LLGNPKHCRRELVLYIKDVIGVIKETQDEQ